MIALFQRQISVEILPLQGLSRTFANPFHISFETEFDRFNSSTVRLFNPNKQTIAATESQKSGRGRKYPQLNLTAGYKDEHGMVVSGEIYESKTKKEGPDNILEMKVSEKAGSWGATQIMKNYYRLNVSLILPDIISRAKLELGLFQLGSDVRVSHYSRTLKNSIENLCKLSESEYYWENGKINIQPLSPSSKNAVILLDYSSGLIGHPEKDNGQWKVRSLFRHKLKKNVSVRVSSAEFDGQLRITKGKHKFSNFESDSYTEFLGVPE